MYVTLLGRSGRSPAVEIHCDWSGLFGSHVPQRRAACRDHGGPRLEVRVVAPGDELPVRVRLALLHPTPVLNSLIGTRLGMCRTKSSGGACFAARMTRHPVPAGFHPGRLVLAQANHAAASPLPPPAVRISTLPRKTCDRVAPDLSTSTPNSVPRSVTMAVGVRTTKDGEGGVGIGMDFGFGLLFRRPSSAFPLCLHSCRQLAQREEAAGGGIDFVGAGPLRMTLAPLW